MERSKRIVFVSHCILNQNTVVPPLARAKGPYKDTIKTIMEYDIGIHQLPCPEIRHLGLNRKPMTKAEYDTTDFRGLSRKISKDTINVIKEYLDNGYEIVGIIGINHSPTCGIRGEKGIFMEELMDLIDIYDFKMQTIDVPMDYHDGEKGKEFIDELKIFLNKSIS